MQFEVANINYIGTNMTTINYIYKLFMIMHKFIFKITFLNAQTSIYKYIYRSNKYKYIGGPIFVCSYINK